MSNQDLCPVCCLKYLREFSITDENPTGVRDWESGCIGGSVVYVHGDYEKRRAIVRPSSEI